MDIINATASKIDGDYVFNVENINIFYNDVLGNLTILKKEENLPDLIETSVTPSDVTEDYPYDDNEYIEGDFMGEDENWIPEIDNIDMEDSPLVSKNISDKYRGIIIQGSHFPDKPIISTMNIAFNTEIKNEYIPAIKSLKLKRGFELLLTAMTHMEGFKKGSRSYRYNNPGNIGNTDSGANKGYETLKLGIERQRGYILSVIGGKNGSFPINKSKNIPPYHSPEIEVDLPGYKFTYTGQLDQFVKIYSTGARRGNLYLSVIISLFKKNGMILTPESKIQDIIYMS